MLKLPYFGHLMQRADSLEKTLMLGKSEGKRRRGWQRMKCLDSISDSMDMHLSKLWETVKDRGACVLQSKGSQRVEQHSVTEQQQHSTVYILSLCTLLSLYLDDLSISVYSLFILFY